MWVRGSTWEVVWETCCCKQCVCFAVVGSADAQVSSFCNGDWKWRQVAVNRTSGLLTWSWQRSQSMSGFYGYLPFCSATGLCFRGVDATVIVLGYVTQTRYSPEVQEFLEQRRNPANVLQVPHTHPKHKRHMWHLHIYIFVFIWSVFCECLFVFFPFELVWNDSEVCLNFPETHVGLRFSHFLANSLLLLLLFFHFCFLGIVNIKG